MLQIKTSTTTFPVIFGKHPALKKKLESENNTQVIEIDPEDALPLIFVSPDMATEDLKYEDPERGVVELTPEVAIYHGERVQTLHEKTLGLLQLVLPQIEQWPVSPRSRAVCQLVGYIDLTLKFQQMQVQKVVVWKYPESGLHPALQASMGDMVIQLDNILKHRN